MWIIPLLLISLLVGVMAVNNSSGSNNNTNSGATTNQTIVGNNTSSTATTNQTQICAKEGENVYVNSKFGVTSCCSKNAGVKPTASVSGEYCVATNNGVAGTCVENWWKTCGDGVCQNVACTSISCPTAEDKCNCPADCGSGGNNSQGCTQTCKAIGTRSEGWYNSCTGELIIYANCGANNTYGGNSSASTNETKVIYCEENQNEPNCICRLGEKRMIFEENPCKVEGQMEICTQGYRVMYTCVSDIYIGNNTQETPILEETNVSIAKDIKATQEKLENNKKLNVSLSNGRKAEIKVMPSSASETAIARLGELNFTVELKETGKGENTKLNYELKAEKNSKILGLFSKKMEVKATINAETGEVSISKPWWAFLAVEEK